MSRPAFPLAHPAQHGMTLIEVLVTLVIISVGLLGVAALQLTSLKSNQESYVRSQAAMLAADLLDRMRANQAGFLAGDYDAATFDGTGRSGTTGGTDMTAWQATINRLLPGDDTQAAGKVERDATTNVVTITIQWAERAERSTARTYTAGTLPTFRTRSEI
jgi:type IV pilus assembly protein PilV